MSGVDLHPEELLDRVLRGQATEAEQRRAQRHLQGCEACRFERALLAQSTRDAAPRPGDAARARRIEQAAVAALAARGVLAPKPAPRHRRRAAAVLAAAVASSIATAAAAAVITQPAWLSEWLPAKPAVQQVPAREQPKTRRLTHKAAPKVEVPASAEVEAPGKAPEQVRMESPARPAPARRAGVRDAAELFAAANAARRERSMAEAVRLYRELAREHPRSAEAAVARVALGRLLLDRRGDARGALREFDAYLADPEQRTLREDALIGRALALGRLGRSGQERAGWSALLAAFPASAYAEHARARLKALRCSAPPC